MLVGSYVDMKGHDVNIVYEFAMFFWSVSCLLCLKKRCERALAPGFAWIQASEAGLCGSTCGALHTSDGGGEQEEGGAEGAGALRAQNHAEEWPKMSGNHEKQMKTWPKRPENDD